VDVTFPMKCFYWQLSEKEMVE